MAVVCKPPLIKEHFGLPTEKVESSKLRAMVCHFGAISLEHDDTLPCVADALMEILDGLSCGANIITPGCQHTYQLCASLVKESK